MANIVNGLTDGLSMGAVVVPVVKDNPRFAFLACPNIVIATKAGSGGL
jgi:hypothetical protein